MKFPAPILRQPRIGAAHRPTMTIAPAPRPGTRAGAVKNYDAAMQGRLTGDWKVSQLSADAELQGKLPIIRSRSRDLERNDPYVENFLALRENNVVGHDGFSLQMKVKLSEEQDPETGEVVIKYDAVANRKIERAWKEFCRRANFLTTRNMDATDACKLIERTQGRDGELLIRKVKGAPNKFGFALQLMEADFLDDRFIDFRGVECNCPEERRLPDGRPFPKCERGMHQVRMGVELHGDFMFPVAYWLLTDHPGDYFFGNQFSVKRERVLVEEIIHPFVFKRIGQTRGIPAMVAAMLALQMRGGYDEATLVKARAAAQKMGFLEKEIPDSIADQYMDEWQKAFGPQPTIAGEPGQIEELPMGVKFKPWDPQDPSPTYEPFTKVQLRGAACAGGVSYASLANDPSDANFSATRIGMLEEREGYRGGQERFIANVLLEAFPDWLECAMLTGQVDLPFSRFDEFIETEAVNFGGRSFPWIDPQKDIAAAKIAIDEGLTTRAKVIRENSGDDFEEVTNDLGREKKLRQAAGIVPPDAPAPDPDANETDEPGDGDDALETAVKSAYLGDVRVGDLPGDVQDTIGKFVSSWPDARVIRAGMTPAELVDKADQRNLAAAYQRVGGLRRKDAADLVRGAADKHVLLLNDRVVDGHHHLAKAVRGQITSSLPVLDLTPLRFQTPPAADPDAAVKTYSYTDADGVFYDIAVKRDGWVTINGAAVHFGPDGKVDSGPAGIVRHFGRKEAGPDGAKPAGVLGTVGGRALSAGDFTHSRRADANGHALHFMPAGRLEQAWSKDKFHLPAGGVGASEKPGARARFKEFVDKGQPIHAPEVHVDAEGTASFLDGRHRAAVLRDAGLTHVPVTMTGASRANAERHGLFSAAEEPAKKRTPRSFTLPFAPTGAMDAIDHIADQGGIMSHARAKKRDNFDRYAGDYDDAPNLRGIYHHAVFGGTMRPDQMATELHALHGIGDGSVGGMYGAINDAITTRQSVQKEAARQKQVHQQGERFDRDALVQHKGDKTVHVSNLSEGDVLTIHGEKVRVKKVDPDSGEVTLQDHTKYGVQKVSDGQALYVEHVEQKEHEDPF